MAKKFKFTLEAVDTLRTYKTEVSKNTLLQITAKRIENDNTILDLVNQKDSIISQPTKGTALDQQLQTRSHISLLDQKIKKQREERQRLLEIEAIKRKDYTSKLQDQEAIRTLREKQLETHKLEMKKEENDMLEEIALSRYSQKGLAG